MANLFSFSIKFIFIFFLFFSTSLHAEYEESKAYKKKIIEEYISKCKNVKSIDHLNCKYDNSPKKCKSLVYIKSSEITGNPWSRCVYSCGSASVASKSFGDCSI